MTTYELQPVDTDAAAPSLAERARKLAAGIRERADRVEAARNVDPESIREMTEAGLFRALLPSRFGGLEADPSDFFAALLEISRACTSTGWVLGILGVHPWEIAHFPLETQEAIYGDDPDTLVSSSYSPQGTATITPGGFTVRGSWKSSSGVAHSKWAIIGVIVKDPDNPDAPFDQRHAVIPLSECTIVDDWNVLGMRGTGSRTIVVEDVFIPSHYVLRPSTLFADSGPGLEVNTAPVYRFPFWTIFQAAATAPILGTTRSFLEEFTQFASDYVRRTNKLALRDDPLFKWRLTDAVSSLDAAEQAVFRNYRDIYDALVRGETVPNAQRSRSYYDMSRAAETAVNVITTLIPYMGARVVYDGHVMQRYLRDLITMRQHLTQVPELFYESIADGYLGLEVVGAFNLSADAAAEVRAGVAQGRY